jgi:hypothetical protein
MARACPYDSRASPVSGHTSRGLVYVTVVAVAGVLALLATALPGRVALQVRPVTVATAME